MPQNPWIASCKLSASARIRLVCFPHAGGGASTFRTWGASLPAGVEMCPVQLPGRHSRLMEEPFRELPPLVDTLLDALAPALDRPFAVFGHSMGAIIGFELVRALRARGDRAPLHLFVAGCQAPQIPHRYRPLHLMPDDQLVEELRCLNGTDELVFQHAELLEIALTTLRADCALCYGYTYQPAPPLDCAISAFAGVADEMVEVDHVSAWSAQTSAGFKFRTVPGGHFFPEGARESLLQAVAEDLAAHLDRLPTEGGRA